MTMPSSSQFPYKSLAAGLMFCIFFGPVGLLYASFWGGLIMIFIAIIVFSSKLFYPCLLLWLGCCIWGVAAIETYNHKLIVNKE